MKRHFILNRTGTRLCLHQIDPPDVSAGTVVLAHGMFSNYRACRGLAKYIASLGFECWLLDSQGHGHSDQPAIEPSFESLALDDTHAVLEFFCNRDQQPLWWIGHSGGGLAMLMYLSRYPEQQSKLAGLVTLASQTTEAGRSWHKSVLFRVSRILLKVFKVAPGKLLGLGPENEFAGVMDQWLAWSINGRWSGSDEFDYLHAMQQLTVPCLALAAVGDRFIAPSSGIEKIHKAYGSSDKTFMVFGKNHGHLEDYTHARLVSSRNASVDVWPLIGEWLRKRNERKY